LITFRNGYDSQTDGEAVRCTSHFKEVKDSPLCHRDVCLFENGSKKISSDFASMRIGNPYPEMLSDHELVFPA